MPRSPKTLGEVAAEYIEYKERAYAANTARAYRLALNQFVRAVGPDLGIRSVTSKHCQTYFLTAPKARVKVLKPQSFNHEKGLLSAFFSYCVLHGYCLSNPMASVPNVRVPKAKRLRLSADELRQMLDMQEHPRDRAVVAMAINTALRASELASLRLSDVDLDQGVIYTTLHKNNKADAFPITADLDAELRRWLTKYAQVVGVLKPDYFLLPAKQKAYKRKGNKFVTDPDQALNPTASSLQYIRKPVHTALKALGYPALGEGLHTVRRSVAALYYEMLVNSNEPEVRDDALRMTQELLGHSTIQITERYIGMDRIKEKRDVSLKGKPFLSALVHTDNVVQLRGVGTDGAPRADGSPV